VHDGTEIKMARAMGQRQPAGGRTSKITPALKKTDWEGGELHEE